MRRRWGPGASLLLAVTLMGSGCRCGGGTLGGVELGFTVEDRPVDFGRALEGAQVTRAVRLVSTGRGGVQVEVSTDGPFSAASPVELEGGGSSQLPVTFTAGVGPASGRLSLSANGKSVSLELSGEGVRALDCVPTAECRQSRFVLESASCQETVAPDGTSCRPTSACLENGLCRSGQCMGAPRACDDRNKCTADACADDIGCLHTQIACPPPQQPCRVPACDAEKGCTDAPAPDGTPCGAIDCVSTQLCIGGECRKVPTPEGFVCSPPTPCQGEGRCRSQKCERPDAGEMSPKVAVTLTAAPRTAEGEPAMLAHNGNLFWEGCQDSGPDAGCALWSYTGTGFQRFATPHADGHPRTLLAVSDAGVVLLAPGALEAIAQGNGKPLWSFPLTGLSPPPEADGGVAQVAPASIALGHGGEAWGSAWWARPGAGGDAGTLPDGGVLDGGSLTPVEQVQTVFRVEPDGGLGLAFSVVDAGTRARAALDEVGRLVLYDPRGALLTVEPTSDGGLQLRALGAGPGAPSLAVAGDRALVGGAELWDVAAGTRVATLAFRGDGGESGTVLGQHVLLSSSIDRGFVPFRACASGTCAPADALTRLRAFDLVDGGSVWETIALPAFLPGRLEESAVVTGGAVATVTEVDPGGAPQAHVQLFAEGRRLFVCPFPAGAQVRAAVFERGFLYALVQRAPTDWRFEAYDLMGLPLETSGWPQRAGVAGSRRARP